MVVTLIVLFIAGYTVIAIEQWTEINKAAIALILGAMCWLVFITNMPDPSEVNAALLGHLGNIAGILLFLLGAMATVELVDAHDGFDIITTRITATSKVKLMWIVALITFFLSAVLDNLTTSIVMVSLLSKLVAEARTRHVYAGVVVLAANAGGAWSPIGDVTTTMLWIGGQVTSYNIVVQLLVPSLVCIAAPLAVLSFTFRGSIGAMPQQEKRQTRLTGVQKNAVFFVAMGVLVLVPVIKTITHLPPYMGMLMGLGVIWVFTEILHRGKPEQERDRFSVAHALRNTDTTSILFFFGILAAVAALESAGILENLAIVLKSSLGDDTMIVFVLGILSAIIDNVPLVAAVQGMYPLSVYPVDHSFWEFLAYCTGAGGSMLIIGSAAGVAVMGLERITFGWYLRKIGPLAMLGYVAGAVTYLLLQGF